MKAYPKLTSLCKNTPQVIMDSCDVKKICCGWFGKIKI